MFEICIGLSDCTSQRTLTSSPDTKPSLTMLHTPLPESNLGFFRTTASPMGILVRPRLANVISYWSSLSLRMAVILSMMV